MPPLVRRSRGTAYFRRSSAYLISIPVITLAACGTRDEPAASGPIELALVREIARPTTDPSTDWLGRSRDLQYDDLTGHLFAINIDNQVLVESDLQGQHVRTYGKFGPGPGELRNPNDYVLSRDGPVVIDLGNGKIARFARDGSVRERRIEHFRYGWDEDDDGRLYAIPGWDGEAITVFEDDIAVGALGSIDVVPGLCVSCWLRVLEDGFLIVEPGRPELILLDRAGELRRNIPLDGVRDFQRWREEEAAILGTRPELVGGKNWISDVAVLSDNRFLLAISPPNPHERGWQLWDVDVSSDLITRYRYDQPEVGADITAHGSRLFVLSVRDGAILEYQLP